MCRHAWADTEDCFMIRPDCFLLGHLTQYDTTVYFNMCNIIHVAQKTDLHTNDLLFQKDHLNQGCLIICCKIDLQTNDLLLQKDHLTEGSLITCYYC